MPLSRLQSSPDQFLRYIPKLIIRHFGKVLDPLFGHIVQGGDPSFGLEVQPKRQVAKLVHGLVRQGIDILMDLAQNAAGNVTKLVLIVLVLVAGFLLGLVSTR
jgi:hypothetical protein